MKGLLERWLQWAKRHPWLLSLSLVGLYGLWDGLASVAFSVAVVAIALALLARVSQFARALGLVLGTIAVPWLCLLGFNVLLENLVLSWAAILKPGLELGLTIGVLVFWAVATRLLVLWDDRLAVAIATGALLALVNVAGLPLLLGSREKPAPVASAQALISRLDAIVVVPGRTAQRVERDDEPEPSAGWQVRYAVARAGEDGRPRWLTLGTDDAAIARVAALGGGPAIDGRPDLREGADRLVLLNVDGTPPVTPRPWELAEVDGENGEIARWTAIAGRLDVPKDTPVVALLQTTDQRRLDAWDVALRRHGGFAVSVQRRRARSITDAALNAAVESPTAVGDLPLAIRFRPLLLFARESALERTPLDVDVLLSKGIMQLCRDERIDGAEDCEKLAGAAGLVNGATHLKLPPPRALAPLLRDVPTRIYAHPSHHSQGKREFVYLDYWWYLPSNPNKVGKGGFCGAGLALPGITCFEHESDWEGVTVVVERIGDDVRPVAVQYAQHSDIVRYSFAQLRDEDWSRRPIRRLLHDVGVKSIDTLDRPLVFVASGSHASYPTPCRRNCRQRARPEIGEDPHHGRAKPTWPGNDANRCLADSCVHLTPTRARGSQPALWNAYEGVWGERRCILRSYCTAEASPAAPGTQKRYRAPRRITGYAGRGGRFVACRARASDGKPACPPLPRAG